MECGSLLRERNNLVKARTQAINRLHNLLDRYDLNPKDFAQDIWREKALKALDSMSLADPSNDYVLHRYVRGIKHHSAELGLLEKKIAGHASCQRGREDPDEHDKDRLRGDASGV